MAGAARGTLGRSHAELTGSEFSLLEALARQAGQLVSKQDLSLNALGRPLTRYDRRIDVHVSSIRQNLARVPMAAAGSRACAAWATC